MAKTVSGRKLLTQKDWFVVWSGTRGLGGQWVVQRKSLFSDWCYIQAKSTRRIQETHSRQRISVETVTIYFDSLFSDDNVAVNNLLPSLSSCAGRRPFSVLSNSPLSLQNFKRWLRLRTPWWRQWELRNVGHDFLRKEATRRDIKGIPVKEIMQSLMSAQSKHQVNNSLRQVLPSLLSFFSSSAITSYMWRTV